MLWKKSPILTGTILTALAVGLAVPFIISRKNFGMVDVLAIAIPCGIVVVWCWVLVVQSYLDRRRRRKD